MIPVTKDNRCGGENCEAAGVPCTLPDDEETFLVLLAKLEEMNSTEVKHSSTPKVGEG